MSSEKISWLLEMVHDFLDSGIGHILGNTSVEPVTGYAYIVSQLREMFIMVVCGACIAFLFEVYESILSDTGKRGAIGVVLDLLFCVMSALVAARFWYVSSCGRISFHEAAAMLAGILLGRLVFAFKNSKPVRTLAAVYVIMLITAYIVIV